MKTWRPAMLCMYLSWDLLPKPFPCGGAGLLFEHFPRSQSPSWPGAPAGCSGARGFSGVLWESGPSWPASWPCWSAVSSVLSGFLGHLRCGLVKQRPWPSKAVKEWRFYGLKEDGGMGEFWYVYDNGLQLALERAVFRGELLSAEGPILNWFTSHFCRQL